MAIHLYGSHPVVVVSLHPKLTPMALWAYLLGNVGLHPPPPPTL